VRSLFRYNRAVSSTPLLRAINLSIAVLVAALLAALYWYAWRPLPETSGQIAAPISAKASISRDARGVPHISAASWEDAIFLQGYATAQDRMWQMDAIRRLAAGELAEVVGKQALQSDQESRQLRLARIADENQRTLPAADRAVLAAYARGVNYYLETHRGRLPLEFAILNYDPRPWTIRDSLLAGLEMYRTLTSSWRLDLNKFHMIEQGDPAKVEFLFPGTAASAVQPGSNAWAVSGAHSANGKPILASDPHLEFAIPETWYLVQLQAPGLDVTGASIPGLPAVIIGHNERVAWGVTNLQFDVQDLYREQIDPRSGRYLYRGQTEQAAIEREAIAVKGAKPFELLLWITRHGPVLLNDEGRSYSLRWVAAGGMAASFPFLDLNRANNWQEFTAALARFPGPGQNFVYADVDGNIGYHATGLLPIRKYASASASAAHESAPHHSTSRDGPHCTGDVPADGATGDCEWDGFIPFDELPQSYNPASGVIESSNQNPFPSDYPYLVGGNFASSDRARQVRALLGSQAKWRPEEMLRIQKDVYSALSDLLARQTVAAWDANQAANPQLRDTVDVFRGWNGQMEKGTAAPMLVALTQHFRSLTENSSLCLHVMAAGCPQVNLSF